MKKIKKVVEKFFEILYNTFQLHRGAAEDSIRRALMMQMMLLWLSW